jgi:hypothetical protein
VKPSASKRTMAVNGAAVCLLGFGFFWPVHFFQDSALWERLMDAAHLPLFFGITWYFHLLLPPDGRRGARVLKIAGAGACLAGLVELVQPLTGRSGSIVDFRNGVAGVLAGCVAVQVWQTRSARRWGPVLVLVVGGAFAWALWPAWLEGQGVLWRGRQFPLLGDFEAPAELRLWQAQGGEGKSLTEVHITAEHATRGAHALQVATGRGSWSGVNYVAGDRDWSARRILAADFFNPEAEFTLYVRVDDDGDCDRMGQRFDREWHLKPGSNRLEITTADLENGPQGRKLNLRAIRRVVFFTGQDQPGRTFFLDNVRLE